MKQITLAAAMVAALTASVAAFSTAAETTRPDSLFAVYAHNRAQGIPSYVTPDLSLIAYSLLRQGTIVRVEAEEIRPRLVQLLTRLDEALVGAAESQAVSGNRHFVGLLRQLLDGSGQCVSACAEEKALVIAAEAVKESPLWGRIIDYTQFKPRGRYAGDAQNEGFFRAMRYAGVAFFAVQPSAATGIDKDEAERQTAQAVDLVRLIDQDQTLRALRNELEDQLAWQFGPPEDLTDADLLAVAGGAQDLEKGDVRGRLLAHAREHHRQPAILDAIIDKSRLERGLTVADVVTGWRLLPSRYDADAAAFQRLTFDQTGAYTGPADAQPFGLAVIDGRPVKGFPLAVELAAALGSRAADERLCETNEREFTGYAAAAADARRLLGDASGAAGLSRLIIRSGLNSAGSAAQVRRLESLLAFWTWQKYLDVLYTKQAYTVGTKGLAPVRERPGADLEPATDLYTALAHAARRHFERTQSAEWSAFATWMDQLVALSFKKEQGRALTAADERMLNELDRTLGSIVGGYDQPIVVDVHTEPNTGRVVEEATGLPAVVTVGTARGAYLTHREFKQPMQDRLTNDQWRARLLQEGP